MPRKLPPYVDRWPDRHGKVRIYFRKGKGPRTPLPGKPGSEEFRQVLAINVLQVLAGDRQQTLGDDGAIGLRSEASIRDDRHRLGDFEESRRETETGAGPKRSQYGAKHSRDGFMTAKKLQLVQADPPASPAPPRALGEPGMALWRSVTSEYDIADCGGIELLTAACQSLDRAERCRAQIDADGEVIRTKTGIRDHPLLKHEVAARSFTMKAIRHLGLDVEALRPGPGRPPGR